MATPVVFHFSWDPAKAASNRRKHGIDFELAATVFRDPLALSRTMRTTASMKNAG